MKIGLIFSVKSSYRSDWYIQNQWIVFLARSDWLLKLGIVSAIHLPACILLDFAREFCLISQEKELFGADRLHWFGIILKQLFTSVSVKSGRYLPSLR